MVSGFANKKKDNDSFCLFCNKLDTGYRNMATPVTELYTHWAVLDTHSFLVHILIFIYISELAETYFTFPNTSLKKNKKGNLKQTNKNK